MKVSVRDLGLLLLGTGVFILAVVALHFYLTQILPASQSYRINAFCVDMGDKYVVRIWNYGSTEFRSVIVRTGDKNLCSFPSIPPGSSQVCILDVNEELVPFEVSGIIGGRTITYSDVCRRVEVVVPQG